MTKRARRAETGSLIRAAGSLVGDSLNRLSFLCVMVAFSYGFFWLLSWPVLALLGHLAWHSSVAGFLTTCFVVIPLDKKALAGKPYPRWQDLESSAEDPKPLG